MLHLNKKGLLKDHYHLWILNYVKLAIEDQVELSYYRSSIERVEIHGGLRLTEMSCSTSEKKSRKILGYY